MRSHMRRSSCLFLMMGFLLVIAVPDSSEARVVRFVVEQQRSFAGGVEWGTSGAYERLDGTAYMEVDSRNPLNAGIVNLDKAPRNDRGMVEYSAPFFILKPVDMARGNQKIWYAINNRGNKSGLLSFPPAPLLPSTNDPLKYAGDGLQLRLGYTIVDAGWQGDVAPGDSRLFPNFPVATQPDGSPIVAAVRTQYSDRAIPQAGTFTLTLQGNPNFRSYETADTNTAHSTLVVLDTAEGPKVSIPSDRWAFGRCPEGEGSLVPTTTDICLFDGFQANKLYELIYPAKNPIVMGLGYAVTRDIGSFLRYETQDEEGNPNPLALSPTDVGIRRAYSSGTSSTGMYQRDWLYLGFNEDESHRKVFDAVTIHTAGAHRLFANVEFAHPDTYSRQDVWHDFLSYSHPPLTFAVTTDPLSGIRGGILKRPATDPLVFQIDGEAEFWHWQASLNVADSHGRPVRVPDNVRLYQNSGFGHIGVAGLLSPPGPRAICQNLTQGTAGQSPTLRALLVALDAWADQGREPPPSNYPRLRNQTLVSLDEYRAAFPAIPGAAVPTVLNELELLDFGPEFGPEGGRLTILPPLRGPRYTVLVPKSDKDGVGIAGIRTMETRAPLGTNTGWNGGAPGFRAPDHCWTGLAGAGPGSFIPFATTEAERLASGDPRESLEERYGDHAGFVGAVRRAAQQLLRQGFLLLEDANTFISAAEESDVLK